jgi:GH15 family glucan-1,4-alpha-glucosidase
VALDRAIKMSQKRARSADVTRWTAERDAVYNQVFDQGWHP